MSQQKDETNFTSSSSHRLPTVSAASALEALSSSEKRNVSTSLPALDAILSANSTTGPKGGLVSGQVTEVYGPPGVGKTTFGMQAVANSLHSGRSVVWIDTSHQLVGPRLASIISQSKCPKGEDPPSSPPPNQSLDEMLSKFHHFQAPTLPHLLALLAYQSESFPPRDTGLIVIDNVSNLFATAFPKATDGYDSGRGNKPDAVQWASGRRWAVMGDFTARANKLASVRNIAMLLLNQTSTKVKTEYGALLRPALSTKAWLENVSTRLVMFRDFVASDSRRNEAQSNLSVRFFGVVKHAGVLYESLERVIPFIIDKTGMHQVNLESQGRAVDASIAQASVQLAVLPGKRKRDEVADSQSEGSDDDFAWIEDDPSVLLNEGEVADDDPGHESGS